MAMLLIGSTRLKQLFPDYRREPKDVDFFTNEDRESSRGVEYFYHPALRVRNGQATADELYTIKVSHIFWDNGRNWEKHLYDIQFLQSKGAKLIPHLYDTLYAIWEERFGKKKAKLNVSAEDFFKATVKRVYEHDSIHASVAYYDAPLFNRILKDWSEVAVDRSRFDALAYEDKLKLVREEVYATSLERQIIPSDYKMSPRAGYAWALKKTITSFSKGWFPLFIIENINQLSVPDVEYVKLHKTNSHLLIPLEG